VRRLLECRQPQLVAHAVLSDHVTGHLRRLLQIVLGARGNIAEDDLFGHAPTQQHIDPVEQLGARTGSGFMA
jgi:hypothetical protein